MKVYFKNLDALRFLAFLSVFVSHAALFVGYESKSGWFEKYKSLLFTHGDLGVNFFFVLSGFLITYLLLSEKTASGNISLLHFYLRRMFRIWPLYFVVIIAGFCIVSPVAHMSGIQFPFLTGVSVNSLPWYVFFGANFRMAFYPLESIILAVGWSICVEEQFYLLWPLALARLPKKNIPILVACVVAVSFGYRYIYYQNYNIISYSTFSVMSALAMGAGTACLTMYAEKFRAAIESTSKQTIVLVYVAMVCLVPLRVLTPHIFSGFMYRIIYSGMPLVFSCLFAFVILEQNLARHSFIKFGDYPALNYLGIRSYGLYCYHLIALFFTLLLFYYLGAPLSNYHVWLYLGELLAAFMLTIGLSVTSYRFLERPFMSLKARYGYKRIELKKLSLTADNVAEVSTACAKF